MATQPDTRDLLTVTYHYYDDPDGSGPQDFKPRLVDRRQADGRYATHEEAIAQIRREEMAQLFNKEASFAVRSPDGKILYYYYALSNPEFKEWVEGTGCLESDCEGKGCPVCVDSINHPDNPDNPRNKQKG